MLCLFELSGEHATLPMAELRGIMEAEKAGKEIYHNNRLAIFDISGKIKKIAGRLALSHSINEVLASGKKHEVENAIRNIQIEGSFKIEVINFDKRFSSNALKKEFGKKMMEATHSKVNIKHPENLIKIYSYKKLYITKELFKIDRHQFEERKQKPFELPITIHPRLARAMVNIARVREKNTIIDPFCGTGTILIEAGLMRAKVIGIETKKWIADGCKKNMEYFGIESKIYADDMRNVNARGNAIVTDFPYGRASYVGGNLKNLYEDAFKKFDEWIESGYIMAGISNREFINIGKKYFELLEIHPYRVHKSLTRFLCLFKKEK